jgi:hypothetical protein
MSGKFFIVVPIAVLAIGGSAACATKKYVRTNVGEVNEKVDSLGRSVEETQERTRQNEGKIADVDTRAQAAARDAHNAADQAAGAGGGGAPTPPPPPPPPAPPPPPRPPPPPALWHLPAVDR